MSCGWVGEQVFLMEYPLRGEEYNTLPSKSMSSHSPSSRRPPWATSHLLDAHHGLAIQLLLIMHLLIMHHHGLPPPAPPARVIWAKVLGRAVVDGLLCGLLVDSRVAALSALFRYHLPPAGHVILP